MGRLELHRTEHGTEHASQDPQILEGTSTAPPYLEYATTTRLMTQSTSTRSGEHVQLQWYVQRCSACLLCLSITSLLQRRVSICTTLPSQHRQRLFKHQKAGSHLTQFFHRGPMQFFRALTMQELLVSCFQSSASLHRNTSHVFCLKHSLHVPSTTLIRNSFYQVTCLQDNMTRRRRGPLHRSQSM
jgi:hypothetical protein